MFRIGEFASFAKVPVKTLRYYDEIGIFTSAKVDEESGYRYYSAEQLIELNKILSLRDIGFSLNQISYIMKNNVSSEKLIHMLNLKKMEVIEVIEKERERKRKIDLFINNLNEEDIIMNYDIVVKEVKPFKGVCLRDIVPNYSEMHALWKEVGEHIANNNSKILPGCLAIYYDPSFKESQVDVEVVELVSSPVPETSRIKIREIPGAKVASVIHKGSYENYPKTYTALLKWIEENKFTPCGPNREIYIEGEWSAKEPEDYITEIQIPIRKAE